MRLRAAGALSTCKRRETRRLISGVGGGGDWGMENGKLVKGMRTFFFIDWMANFKWQFFFSNFTLIAKVEKKINVTKTRG